MATNNGSPHLQIRHNMRGFYISPIVIAFNTLCPVQFYIQWCVALHRKLIGGHTLKNWFVPALEVNFLKKLPQLVALKIFQSSHLSHGESPNHNILLHYPHIEHIFENTLYIYNKKDTKFGFDHMPFAGHTWQYVDPGVAVS